MSHPDPRCQCLGRIRAGHKGSHAFTFSFYRVRDIVAYSNGIPRAAPIVLANRVEASLALSARKRGRRHFLGGRVISPSAARSVLAVVILLGNPGYDSNSVVNLGIADNDWDGRAAIRDDAVRVRNLGQYPATGDISVEVIRHDATVIWPREGSSSFTPAWLPARHQGGDIGRWYKIPNAIGLKSLLDSLDSRGERYTMTATIVTHGSDSDWSDNVKARESEASASVRLSSSMAWHVEFRNRNRTEPRVRLKLEPTPLPSGWRLTTPVGDSTFVDWPRNGIVKADLVLITPATARHGSSAAIRLSAVDVRSRIVAQRAWYVVFDTLAPFMGSYRLLVLSDQRVAIQVNGGDEHSGIRRRGVVTEYSLDDGRSWRGEAHDHKVGDAGWPSTFEVVFGPFRKGQRILVRLSAVDVAGNVRHGIPADASAFLVPVASNRVIHRTQTLASGAAHWILTLPEAGDSNAVISPEDLDPPGLDAARQDSSRSARHRASVAHLAQRRMQDLRELETLLDTLGLDPARIVRLPLERLASRQRTNRGEDVLGVVIP